jgi:hypothetical protein
MRAPAAPAHEAGQQARSVCEALIADRATRRHTLRACGSGRPLQPPSPCRRARPRSGRPTARRLTGLSAALRHKAPLAAGLLPVRRGARLLPRKTPRPSNPPYVNGPPAHPALAEARRSCGAVPGCPCALRCAALPARHPWLALGFGKSSRCARSCTSASATPRAARLIVARSTGDRQPGARAPPVSRSCRRSRCARTQGCGFGGVSEPRAGTARRGLARQARSVRHLRKGQSGSAIPL